VPLILQSQIIGSQRMRGKGAVAKPIYDLRRNPRIQRHLATAKERNPGRLQVRLERGPGRGDVIRGVAEVTGRISYTDDKGTLREFIDDPGSVVVRLRTMMRDEEYWLDSGRFDALPEPGK
jgi:hypothetical protein